MRRRCLNDPLIQAVTAPLIATLNAIHDHHLDQAREWDGIGDAEQRDYHLDRATAARVDKPEAGTSKERVCN